MRITRFLLPLLIMGAVGSSLAQYPEPISLKGLKSVVLQVYADRDIPAIPSTPSRTLAEVIKERAIQRLTGAGIAVLSEKESEALPNASILHLNTYLQCQSDCGSCGYHTDLELRQSVQLTRDRSIAVKAITWRNSYTGGISKAQLSTLPDLLAVDAGTLVLGFVKDFRVANPK